MARPKVSLNEVMGSSGGTVRSLDRLSELLGEKTPRLPINQVGRVRLVQALRNRFGVGFRNMPGVAELIKEFDDKIETGVRINKMKKIRIGNG